nr:hypothetical protein [uncultured Bacteroides sp.]
MGGEEAVQYGVDIGGGRFVRIGSKGECLGDGVLHEAEVLGCVGACGGNIVQGIGVVAIVEHRGIGIEIDVGVVGRKTGAGKVPACHVGLQTCKLTKAGRYLLVGITINVDVDDTAVHQYAETSAGGCDMEHDHPGEYLEKSARGL